MNAVSPYETGDPEYFDRLEQYLDNLPRPQLHLKFPPHRQVAKIAKPAARTKRKTNAANLDYWGHLRIPFTAKVELVGDSEEFGQWFTFKQGLSEDDERHASSILTAMIESFGLHVDSVSFGPPGGSTATTLIMSVSLEALVEVS